MAEATLFFLSEGWENNVASATADRRRTEEQEKKRGTSCVTASDRVYNSAVYHAACLAAQPETALCVTCSTVPETHLTVCCVTLCERSGLLDRTIEKPFNQHKLKLLNRPNTR